MSDDKSQGDTNSATIVKKNNFPEQPGSKSTKSIKSTDSGKLGYSGSGRRISTFANESSNKKI